MDREELLRRFEPLGPVVGGPVPSYQARGPGGQYVQVHQLDSGRPEFARLVPLVHRVQNDPPPDLVEVVDVEGGLAVVTTILPGGVSLEDWLGGAVSGLDQAPPADRAGEPLGAGAGTTGMPPGEPPGDRADRGDYSALFRIPEPGQDQGAAPSERVAAPPPAPPVYRPPEPAPPPPPADKAQMPGDRPLDGRGETREGGPSAPAESITDMFRKPSPPPPPRPDPRRPRTWSPPEREYIPLRLPLDEYLRRLSSASRTQAIGQERGGDRGPWSSAPRAAPGVMGGPAPAVPDPGVASPGPGGSPRERSATAPPPPPVGSESRAPAKPRARDVWILVGVVAFVVVVAAVIVAIVLMRGG